MVIGILILSVLVVFCILRLEYLVNGKTWF